MHQGFWLSTEKEFIDQPKLFEVYRQFERRGQETGISMVSQLNEKIREGCLPQLIKDNENRVARDLDTLADQIAARPELKIVLIAGPSSAGKTTFSRRLAFALHERGRNPIAISMDDSVSYTHLDVYKRQGESLCFRAGRGAVCRAFRQSAGIGCSAAGDQDWGSGGESVRNRLKF